MDRIVVIGVTGSGKSTLAQQLAERLGIPFIEPDALNWHANWEQVSDAVFRQRVDEATRPRRWVFGGNYSKARDIVWTRADTLIWLDYSLLVAMGRLLRRTFQRILTGENLWGTGNRETWRKQFLSRESLFWWGFRQHGRYRRSIPPALEQPEYAHLNVIRFTSPRQTQRWLDALNPDALD